MIEGIDFAGENILKGMARRFVGPHYQHNQRRVGAQVHRRTHNRQVFLTFQITRAHQIGGFVPGKGINESSAVARLPIGHLFCINQHMFT